MTLATNFNGLAYSAENPFAVAVTLFPDTGDERTVYAIFEDPDVSLDLTTQAPILATRAVLTMARADVETERALDQGDALRVAGNDYTVRSLTNSGTGDTFVEMDAA